jgi:hypothetical protein
MNNELRICTTASTPTAPHRIARSTSIRTLLRTAHWPIFAAAISVAMPSAMAATYPTTAPGTYAPSEPAPAPAAAAPAPAAAARGQAAPAPGPSEAPAPALAPAPAAAAPGQPAPAPLVAEAVPSSAGPQEDAVAAAKMVGTEVIGAGSYFLGYGVTLSGMAGLYGQNGNYSAPGIQAGLLVGGAINLGLGGILLAVSHRRLNATDAWLDARPGRRARFTEKARRRGLYLGGTSDEATDAVVRKGRKLGFGGLMIVMGGGVLNGVGVGVSPLSPGAGIGLALTGTSAMIAGAILAARGKKMSFRPRDYVPRGSVAVTPTMLTSPEGQRMAGLSLVARW